MTTSSPLIGVTALHGDDAWVQQYSRNYLAVLAEQGATAVVLAPDVPARLPDGRSFTPAPSGRLPVEVLDHLDGLLLSGGGDVDPKHFGAPLAGAEPESINPPRDELELTLARHALAVDLPLFGICRGCQVLNVAAGGGMVQHFPGHRSPKDGTAYHDILITSGTRLSEIIGCERLSVNTFHHQGVDRASLAPGLALAAVADPDSWLIEGFESPAHRWVVGVQWHPERVFELGAAHQALWRSFLAACRSHARR